MDEANLNPLVVILLYILRCMVPLGIMLGISYLLRRFGVIKAPPPPPEDWNGDENEDDASQGGMAHG
jgi:hypothetical protein